MTKYSRSSLFPDVNVWIALTYTKHAHYDSAQRWYTALPEEARLFFSRFTQISFLRLLTTSAVMGNEVQSQAGAWDLYDDWLREGGASYLEEPASVEAAFRSSSQSRNVAPKDWADSYLAAFASVSGLQFVTFDQAFRGKTEHLLVLRP
jgi:toxin-antitoxin system PIN domain toxin